MDANEINTFVSACNEMIEGKFILADIKISKILRAISSSNDIYNLIAESLINYNFAKEYERIRSINQAEHSGYMELPNDYQVIIPFVFSLLVQIDSKQLDFSEFLSTNFPMSNSQKEEYESFARHVVLPFRNAVAGIFGVTISRFPAEEEPEKQVHVFDSLGDKQSSEPVQAPEQIQQEEQPTLTKEQETALLFDSIARVCGVMREKLTYVKKPLVRSNISLIVDALIEACYLRNMVIAVALVMSLGEITRGERALREDMEEINSICYKFYE